MTVSENTTQYGIYIPVNIGEHFYTAGYVSDGKSSGESGIVDCKVCQITIKSDNTVKFQVSGYNEALKYTTPFKIWFYTSDIGKSVFRTHKDAEQAFTAQEVAILTEEVFAGYRKRLKWEMQ